MSMDFFLRWTTLRRPSSQVVRHHYGLLVKLLRTAGFIFLENKKKILVLALLGIGLGVWGLSPFDGPWLRTVREGAGLEVSRETLKEVARFLSSWGDFMGYNVAVGCVIGLLSLVRRSAYLHLVMIVSIAGACLVGGTATFLRVTAGRARPDSRSYEQGFHGPTIKSQKHSFPSGHTATSFGAAIPVAIAAPPLGVPLVVVAGGIAWSRLYNNKHHPTDVLASILIASLIGIPLGCAARRLRREAVTGVALGR